MFITKGDMPHEGAWATWLSAAKWLVPPAYAKNEISSSESTLPKQVWLPSSKMKTGQQHYREQALFNLYVHAPPNHTGYAPDTVFRDRDISERVQVRLRALNRATCIKPLCFAVMKFHWLLHLCLCSS